MESYNLFGEAAFRAAMMKSLGIKMTGLMYACEGCALAKAKAKIFPKSNLKKMLLNKCVMVCWSF
jgi:hypothetical protein